MRTNVAPGTGVVGRCPQAIFGLGETTCEDRRVTPNDFPPLSTAKFDEFIKGLDYPMFVVTTVAAGQRAGCLVGFTTQASIDPPRLLVCLSVENHTLTFGAPPGRECPGEKNPACCLAHHAPGACARGHG
jgi:hypothetical protein